MSDENVIRISRRALPWFEEAFRAQALGQRVAWDAAFAASQNEQGQMAPAFLLYVETPAHQLGRVHTQFAQVSILGLTEEGAQTVVTTLLGRLHAMRSAEANGAVNGGGGGLVRP